jgi:hypothetical protein
VILDRNFFKRVSSIYVSVTNFWVISDFERFQIRTQNQKLNKNGYIVTETKQTINLSWYRKEIFKIIKSNFVIMILFVVKHSHWVLKRQFLNFLRTTNFNNEIIRNGEKLVFFLSNTKTWFSWFLCYSAHKDLVSELTREPFYLCPLFVFLPFFSLYCLL